MLWTSRPGKNSLFISRSVLYWDVLKFYVIFSENWMLFHKTHNELTHCDDDKNQKRLRKRHIWRQQGTLTCVEGAAHLQGVPSTEGPEVLKLPGSGNMWCCNNFFHSTPKPKEMLNNSIYESIRSKNLKCLYTNNSVALWKNKTHELKEESGIVILFLYNHNYSLLGWGWFYLEYPIFHILESDWTSPPLFFFPHWLFSMVLAFHHRNCQNPRFVSIWHHQENISVSNVKIMSDLELLADMKSSGCPINIALSLEVLKCSWCPRTFAEVPQGILAHSSEIVVIICIIYLL